jgi:predicted Na+-dependent transporter
MNDLRWLQDTAGEANQQENESTDTSAESSKSNQLVGVVLSNVFLFFLIFGLSATVDVKNMKRQLTNRFAIGCGVAMQFIVMPLLGFVAVVSLRNQGLSEAMGIALLVVTSSPGGSYSNWWCSTFNADLALSVAMTTVSSILSICLLPLNLFLYTYLAFGITDEDQESVVEALDFGTLFITLGIVLGAILSGLAAGYRWDNATFHVYANRFGTISGMLLILFSVFFSSGADGAESNFWSQPWAFYCGVAFPCLLGIALANIIARSVRLSPPETVAISIECCYQNTGIATSVAITMFDNVEERAQAVAVPLFYGIIEAVVIGIYCIWAWKVGWTKAPKDENLCLVIARTYEIDENASNDEPHDEEFNGKEQLAEASGPIGAQKDSYCMEGSEGRVIELRQENTQRDRLYQEGSGFWARIFPPILLRKLSSLLMNGVEVDENLEEQGDGVDIKVEGNLLARSRLGTAETSLSSSVSSPPHRSRTGSSMSIEQGCLNTDDPSIPCLTVPEDSEHALPDLLPMISSSTEHYLASEDLPYANRAAKEE